MTYDELATSRPGTTDSSVASSDTHVQSHEKSVSSPPKHTSSTAPGHHGSTPPEHERERGAGGTEEDWEHDPENARNWPLGRKWRAVSVVRPQPIHALSPNSQPIIIRSPYTLFVPH